MFSISLLLYRWIFCKSGFVGVLWRDVRETVPYKKAGNSHVGGGVLDAPRHVLDKPRIKNPFPKII